MDLKVKSYNLYRTESKYSVALVFSIISMLICVFYSIAFIAIGANLAAFIQLIGAFTFMTVVGLLRRRMQTFTRYVGIITSLSLVFIQTIFVFGPGFGFQYQLFALLVIIYLLLDYNVDFERYSIYLFSALIVCIFFISEWLTINPLFTQYLKYEKIFFSLSLFGTFIGLIIVLQYLSKEIFSAKDQLYNMATTDVLTGLYNRRTFIDRGEESFKIAERGGNNFSVILFDIDSFKEINDEYGHLIGDQVLKSIADISRNTVRDTDLISRYGGEEFAVLLHNTNGEQATIVAEKIRYRISEHIISISPYKINRTVSLGVMNYHYSLDSFDEMMDKADKAMYKSKSLGKNQTTLYEATDSFYREKRKAYELRH